MTERICLRSEVMYACLSARGHFCRRGVEEVDVMFVQRQRQRCDRSRSCC